MTILILLCKSGLTQTPQCRAVASPVALPTSNCAFTCSYYDDYLPCTLIEDSSNITIVVNDVMGKQVFKKLTFTVQTELNLAFLAGGVYVLSAYRNEERIYRSKLFMNYK